MHGTRPVNQAGFVIHSAVHHAHPEVVAAAHAHSVYGKAWSSLGRPLDPITQDACTLYENHGVVTEGRGAVVLDPEVGRALATGLTGRKMVFHQNHGIFTVGRHGGRGRVVVRQHRAQLPGPAAGRGRGDARRRSTTQNAKFTAEQTGTPYAGWFAFQPLWDEVVRTDPDLFD